MKTIKVIDLLNKIANGELKDKAVVIFKSHECSTIFHKKDSRFEFSEKGDWNNYFYGIDIEELNDEVEIIEEEQKIPEKFYEMLDTSSNDMTSLRSAVNETRDKCNALIDYLKAKENK